MRDLLPVGSFEQLRSGATRMPWQPADEHRCGCQGPRALAFTGEASWRSESAQEGGISVPKKPRPKLKEEKEKGVNKEKREI